MLAATQPETSNGTLETNNCQLHPYIPSQADVISHQRLQADSGPEDWASDSFVAYESVSQQSFSRYPEHEDFTMADTIPYQGIQACSGRNCGLETGWRQARDRFATNDSLRQGHLQDYVDVEISALSSATPPTRDLKFHRNWAFPRKRCNAKSIILHANSISPTSNPWPTLASRKRPCSTTCMTSTHASLR